MGRSGAIDRLGANAVRRSRARRLAQLAERKTRTAPLADDDEQHGDEAIACGGGDKGET